MSDPTSDNALMTQVRNGDLGQLGVLFERYHRRLFAFFYRLTSRRDVSADLVQDVFERILKYRNSYTNNGAFSTWIFRIARNRHADYYRRMKMEALDEDHDSQFPDRPDQNHPETASDISAADDTAMTDDRLLLEQALNRLHPDKKQALILSRFEGFLYREIAEIMDCSEAAVKVRVFRGLNELKEIITQLERESGRPDRQNKSEQKTVGPGTN